MSQCLLSFVHPNSLLILRLFYFNCNEHLHEDIFTTSITVYSFYHKKAPLNTKFTLFS